MQTASTSDWHPGSKQRLTPRDLHRFQNKTLFDSVGRALCAAECLPRKELYESWEVAKRLLRRAKGGALIDVASGHGLVAWLVTLIDRKTTEAYCVDPTKPPSAEKIAAVMLEQWPALQGRVHYRQDTIEAAPSLPGARVVAVHACGALTDVAIDLALQLRGPIAALPCCQSHGKLETGGLQGWMDHDLAIDATRVGRLRAANYRVWTQTIPPEITPKNRLFVGVPLDPDPGC